MHHLGGVGLALPFNAVTWLFIGAMLAAGAFALRPMLVSSDFWWFLLLGAAILWLPFFYAHAEPTRVQALPRLLGLSGGVLFYLVLQQCRFNASQRRLLLCLLLGLATLQMLFGLVQFFLLPADNWFRFNTRVRLPYGIFMQRNVMSSFVGSGVVLALYLLVVMRAGRARWLMWLWCVLVAVMGIVLVVLLQSRAGLYGLLAGLLLLLPVCWLRLSTWPQRWLLVGMVLLGACAGIVLLLQSDAYKRTLEVYGELGVRYEIWATTLSMIVRHLWLGVGYGGFEPAYYAEAARLLAAGGPIPQMPGGLHHPHNEVLLWLAEGGAITLLAFMLLALGLCRLLLHLPWSERLALLALILPLMGHLMSEYPLGHSSVHWLWLLVVLWFFDSEYGRGRLYYRLPAWPGRALLLTVGLVTMFYMATGLQTTWQLTHFERERFANEERLTAVWNPWFWQDRRELYQHSAELEAALAEGDQSGLQAYLAWSTPMIARLPRSSLLHNHLVALLALGREQEAQTLAERLRLEYPHARQFSVVSLAAIKARLAAGEALKVHRHLSEPVGSATYYQNWYFE
ncbi:PglL family O-oligosaccharyltransferase [Zobellella maritima]|uniref:PglL family O-oligosaccharyltransferase n=1 Tax=Zobellella maritima TaxID=2059725 RepID=UPI0018E4DD64|nr:Wzy polymerase domain-containing protein [Zobellella maritima]